MVKSLIIIKPRFLKYTDDVIDTFKNLGYTETRRTKLTLNQEQCDVIWSDLKQACISGLHEGGLEYYQDYCDYIMSGNVNCVVIESENGNYSDIWITKSKLREKHQVSGYRDLLHASDSNELAENEIACVFLN